ncbi:MULTISPECIES: hypothetical protein [unclassified Microcoleus]|uniref:hypothetical protein n=1 Tax=unclassified Microcoleus TaxID=2642155 RepID=UPI002FCFE519
MSKINFNTENPEIEITRAIGKKSEGKITLNTEGGSIEVDLGFASVGATTDYGGAISVGLLGQEIVWGREGGTIHIGIGGFAVDVEARDCIVTETKSIFGQIVAQRSYPDPGCKLPDPPTPTPTPTPTPGPDGGIDLPNTEDIGWVIFNMRELYYLPYARIPGYDNTTIRTASNIKEKDRTASSLPFKLVSTKNRYNALDYTIEQGTAIHTLQTYTTTGTFGNMSISACQKYPPYTYGFDFVAAFYGKVGTIKQFIELNKQNTDAAIADRLTNSIHTSRSFFFYIPTLFIPLTPSKPTAPKPFLPTGNKPPMKDCCEDVLDMLEDIKEAYAVDRILKDKFPVSNVFMAPGCDPASQTIAKNFYEILQCLFRTLAHGMIFEPRVSIKDGDAAKAGDQPVETKYLNATGWASAIAEALLEVKDDGNVSTNMDIRNAFAVTQTMVGLSDAIYRLNALLDSIGVELIPVVETVDTPYNLQIQIGKGFGEGNERQIDLNTDEATEKLLPELLKVKTNKIKTVETHPRSRSIKDILESIESNLPTINNG